MLFDEILDVDMDEMIYVYYGACLVRLRNICRLQGIIHTMARTLCPICILHGH